MITTELPIPDFDLAYVTTKKGYEKFPYMPAAYLLPGQKFCWRPGQNKRTVRDIMFPPYYYEVKGRDHLIVLWYLLPTGKPNIVMLNIEDAIFLN